MKDVKIKKNSSNIYFPAALAKQVLFAVLGFVFTKAGVKGEIMPFGISFIAGVPAVYLSSAAIGIFVGYFFPAILKGGFRYITVMFAVLSIRILLSRYKKLSENPIFLSGLALVSTVVTGLLTLKGQNFDFIAFICDAFLSASATYFIFKAFSALLRETAGLSGEELSSLLITVNIFLMGIIDVNLYGISLGRVLAVFLILTASKYGGTLSGAVSGIAFSFAAALEGDYSGAFFSYSVGGMTAGIFSFLGRFASISAVLISFLVDNALKGFDSSFFRSMAEALIGSALFILMPKSFGAYIGKIFSVCPKLNEKKGVKNSLNLRLNMASGALNDVSDTLENVSAELSKINLPDFGMIIEKIENATCIGCAARTLCFEKKRNSTINAIHEIIKDYKLQNKGENLADNELKARCIRFSKLYENSAKYYREYSSGIKAEIRIDEIRKVVCNQFVGMSDMLKELATEFDNEEQFNSVAASNAASALASLDIHADEVSAKIDKFGRTAISFRVKNTPETVLNKRQIMKMVSLALELEFDIPIINKSGDYLYISLFEHANYKTDIGINQIPANENILCGDAYSYFNDGLGHTVMILSDGMGTGGRAAVDGAMASGLMTKLITAGFGFDCAVNLINSSMLFKSTDESLATLDIASVDLFTGEVKFYKAGAAPTVVKRSNKTGVATSCSLPIGILEEASFDTARIRLKEKDVILLLSDGATENGTDWIRAELETIGDKTAKEIAEHISYCAKRRSNSEKADDITVMAAVLEKAV